MILWRWKVLLQEWFSEATRLKTIANMLERRLFGIVAAYMNTSSRQPGLAFVKAQCIIWAVDEVTERRDVRFVSIWTRQTFS